MNVHITHHKLLIAAAALLLAAVTGATALASTVARRTAASKAPSLQRDVDALVAGGAPGAILFVRDGNQTSRYAGGFADVARKRPMRARDHFKIASLTKSYTATVVLQLVAEGKLHLTDNVERWLPGLVPNGRKITIRQLLNHTSGIPDYESDPRFLEPYLSGNFAHYWPPRKLVTLAVSHKPLFAPGKTRYSTYANTNYVIAGLIVEAVTGHTIGSELNRRIFRPLHLRDTSYPTKPGLPGPYAHGYMVVGRPPEVDVSGLSPSLSPASGAIVSTADDVADFYRALFAGRLLRADLLKAMKTTIPEGNKVDIPGQRYGLGLERFPTSCSNAWGHNGVIPGYVTFVFSSDNGTRQALLMVNDDTSSLPRAAFRRFIRALDTAYCSTA